MSQFKIPRFLCDTWWYGLTGRLSDKKFKDLALLRKKQGFTAIQLVVGIPPEIGPGNPNAKGLDEAAWSLQGKFSNKYLNHARKRIKILNSLGFLVIVYGGWGHQIEWLGKDGMVGWWKNIINQLNDLNVMYCLAGESNLWIGQEKVLLPDKSTDQLHEGYDLTVSSPIISLGRKIKGVVKKTIYQSQATKRKRQWSEVLAKVSKLTKKPLIIHTIPGEISEKAVNNPNLLAAVTVQTGHDLNSKKDLWQLPLKSSQSYPGKPFINLEPWYEGIRDNFWLEDQIYAYWVSMMSGAYAYCYGAHGVWNAGDGKFLSHWGKQTFTQAMKLTTPQLLGRSHKFLTKFDLVRYKDIKIDYRGDFIMIKRKNNNGKYIIYISDISFMDSIPNGRVFVPLKGKLSKELPDKGQAVIFS